MTKEEKQKAIEAVRQELLERGDESVTFRQLVERFDEIEEVYKGEPWNLEQIYSNFSVLIGKEPCKNAIDREDALMALTGEWTEPTDELIHRFIRRIKALPPVTPAEKAGRWIACSDMLPEENIWVLVTVEQNSNRYQEIMRRHVYIDAWTDNIDNYTDEITAWMPLPEPYKAEGEK